MSTTLTIVFAAPYLHLSGLRSNKDLTQEEKPIYKNLCISALAYKFSRFRGVSSRVFFGKMGKSGMFSLFTISFALTKD